MRDKLTYHIKSLRPSPKGGAPGGADLAKLVREVPASPGSLLLEGGPGPTIAPTTHAAVLPMFSPAAQAPTKRYTTIVADPPWRFSDLLGYHPGDEFGGRGAGQVRMGGTKRSAASNYPTMSEREIAGLPVGLWSAESAHLYLWVPNAFLEEGLAVVRVWGFEYKTKITWVKGRLENGRLVQHIGMGNYFRNSTENVLFGVRGSLRVLNHDTPTAFIAPRGQHSEKPAAFYDLVQHMSPGPYLDVFARKQRFGWDTWGDEAFNFQTDGHWNDGHDDA